MFTIFALQTTINEFMKAIVIDDESFARQNIISILSLEFPDLEVVAEADTVVKALSSILKYKPDLIFLDIDLLDGSGFDVLNQIEKIDFKTIFVTAHQEYAIKAIKFSALDYILKPISSYELVSAVNRVVELGDKNSEEQYESFLNQLNTTNQDKKIVLKTSEAIHVVDVNDIVRCEADNNYTLFYISDGEKIMVSKGLKEYDDLLSEYGFFRVHQSHLINLNCMAKFDKKDGGYVVLNDHSRVPVSQRRKQKLLDYFDSIK